MDDKWIKIYESYEYKDSKLNTKIWLNNLLKENNIPYKNEVQFYWKGLKVPEYKEKLVVYIPFEFKEKVEAYIKDAEDLINTINADNEKTDEYDETKYEAEKTNKRQKRMILGLVIVIMGMVLSMILCGIFIT